MNKIYTILVNKNSSIPEDYNKKIKLVEYKDIDNEKILIEKKTFKQYIKLREYLKKKEGIIIGIESAYRTAKRQEEIYSEFIAEYGKEYADKVVAPINCSEHQTGLAIDICLCIKKKYVTDNNEASEHDEIFKNKVHCNLSKFGFILRYPFKKEDITGYPYEPWHIRFVGKKVAKEIYNNDSTLEEWYLAN